MHKWFGSSIRGLHCRWSPSVLVLVHFCIRLVVGLALWRPAWDRHPPQMLPASESDLVRGTFCYPCLELHVGVAFWRSRIGEAYVRLVTTTSTYACSATDSCSHPLPSGCLMIIHACLHANAKPLSTPLESI